MYPRLAFQLVPYKQNHIFSFGCSDFRAKQPYVLEPRSLGESEAEGLALPLCAMRAKYTFIGQSNNCEVVLYYVIP